MLLRREVLKRLLGLPALALSLVGCGRGSGSLTAPEPAFEPGVHAGPVLGAADPTTMDVQWTLTTPGAGQLEIRPLGGVFQTVETSSLGSKHQVRLEGLSLDTTYEYRLVIDGVPSVARQFKTPPSDPTAPVRYVVMGDMGSGTDDQLTLIQRVRELDPDVIVLVGDVAYEAGTDSDVRLRLLSPWVDILATRPLYITLGNHDAATERGRPLFDAMPLPTNDEEGTKNYFRVDHGCCTFLCLDSQYGFDDPQPPQVAWLDRQLASSRRAWTCGFAHHPIYSRGAHRADPGLVQHVVPRLEQHDVPLFFTGHDHNYQRAHPRRGGVSIPVFGDTIEGPPGPISIITGGGGRGLYDVDDLEGLAVGLRAFHFLYVEATPTTTRIRALGLAGETLDDVTIRKTP